MRDKQTREERGQGVLQGPTGGLEMRVCLGVSGQAAGLWGLLLTVRGRRSRPKDPHLKSPARFTLTLETCQSNLRKTVFRLASKREGHRRKKRIIRTQIKWNIRKYRESVQGSID